jgi:Asp-tRNA(Asn)/Glu-tRNA(Gln) amidotransferase A subunit family amidase
LLEPIGLQVICDKDKDDKAIEIALAFEMQFGEPALPDINKFL